MATITDPSGTAFNLRSSSADVTYSGSIDDVDDTAVYMNNNDNGTVTFQAGTINSPDRGITIINSNNSTITFASAIDLNTASDDALVSNNNDNSILNFTGNINIQTTTGTGFRATGGGTVNVTANNNVIATTNRGTAVEISDTNIGNNDVSFQTINTDKAVNGILLNNTGPDGAFIVAGGTIQNSTGEAVSITNSNANLNQLTVLGSESRGISVQQSGTDDMVVELNGNTIRDSNEEGIVVNVGSGAADNGRLDLTMDGNIVHPPLDPATSGIFGTTIQAQSQTTLCANVSNNQSIGVNGAEDFQLAQNGSASFFLQGFTTDVTTTILNRGNSRTGGGIATVSTIGEPFAGGQNCTQGADGGTVDDTAVSHQADNLYDIDLIINTLPAGKTVTLQFNVQIDKAFPNTVEMISNQALASAQTLPTMVSDNPATSTPNDPTTTTVKTIKFSYLPSILSNYTALPDLIVEQIVIENDDLQITIKNVGNTAVTQPFWVDAYFNPTTPPTQVNQTIQTLGVAGIVWGIDDSILPLMPGESLIITPNDPFYSTQFSNFNGTIPPGELYVQVDSANIETTHGAVLEMDEARQHPYNNISSTTVSRAVRFRLDTFIENNLPIIAIRERLD